MSIIALNHALNEALTHCTSQCDVSHWRGTRNLVTDSAGKHLLVHLRDGSKGAKDNQVGYRDNYLDF